MKASKIIFLVSLLLGNCAPPLILIAVVGLMFPKEEFVAFIWLYLTTVSLLIGSFFSKNARMKRILENCSMILAVVCYRLLFGFDLIEEVPVLFQLPFLISFGLFLYFKLLRYLNRDVKEQQ